MKLPMNVRRVQLLPRACRGGHPDLQTIHQDPDRGRTIAIHIHKIIDLVAAYPEDIRLGALMETVAARCGRMVTFHTGSAAGMDLDGLLHCLEARDKLRVRSGVVYPGGAPVSGH